MSWIETKFYEWSHHVHVEFQNFDFRFVDEDINYSFGMKTTTLTIVPGLRATNDSETLGAFPKHVTLINKRIYCNPVAQVMADAATDDDNIMVFNKVEATVHIPDLHSCLLQPGFFPLGKGKRLRFSAKIDEVRFACLTMISLTKVQPVDIIVSLCFVGCNDCARKAGGDVFLSLPKSIWFF